MRSLDPDIVLFRHLITLDLSHNQLRDLPGTFAKLHSLITLDISFNSLDVIPLGICISLLLFNVIFNSFFKL